MSKRAIELALSRYHQAHGIRVATTYVPDGYDRSDDGREPIARDTAELDSIIFLRGSGDASPRMV